MNAKLNLKYLGALKLHNPKPPRLVNTLLWAVTNFSKQRFFPFHHTDLQEVHIKHPVFSFIIILNNDSAIYRKRYCACGYFRVSVVQATTIFFLLLVCISKITFY